MALDLRKGDSSISETSSDHIGLSETAADKELKSLRRGVITLGREREFRTVGHLALPGLGDPPALTIRIIHIDGPGAVYGHEFRGNESSYDANAIYFLTYKQHMR